jgi:cytoskeleton protein RodZ
MMSEVEMGSLSAEEAVVPPEALPPTAGRLLRSAREAAGLHIAALAVSMKVPVKKLEALEADRADQLLDAVFARALASSVCRALKIDSAPVLALLPQTTKPKFESGDKGINAPFKVPGESRHFGVVEVLKRPVVLVVLGLLLAAVAVLLVPELHWPESTQKTEVVSAPDVATKDAPVEALAVEKMAEPPPVEVVPGPAPTEVTKPAVAEAVAVVPVAPVSGPATPTVSAPVAKASDLVVIRAKGTTWVEVVDATGAVLVRRTLQADGVTSATGVTPLAVVVGKADVAEVEVRGKPFNVSGVAKDNVARFEVK